MVAAWLRPDVGQTPPQPSDRCHQPSGAERRFRPTGAERTAFRCDGGSGCTGCRNRPFGAADRAELGVGPAQRCHCHHRRAERGGADRQSGCCGLGAVGWVLWAGCCGLGTVGRVLWAGTCLPDRSGGWTAQAGFRCPVRIGIRPGFAAETLRQFPNETRTCTSSLRKYSGRAIDAATDD